MTPRRPYQRSVRVEIPVTSGLYKRFIRMEWDFGKGSVSRCMIGFEVEADERTYQVVRYDTDHGGYHRHFPDFPEPSDRRTQLPFVKPNDWLAYARDEITEHYQKWETNVLDNIVLDIEEPQS